MDKEPNKGVDIAQYREEARELAKKYFKDDQGKPIVLTDGQCDIFNLIWKKTHARVHIKTMTRYGKSLAVSLGILMRVTTYPERFSVLAGTTEQSGIIMSYIIQHIFDNPYFSTKFMVDPGESIDAIRRYRNKKRINFAIEKKGGKALLGEVFITNAKGALGFGAPNVVLDEAALVTDDEEALVFRMLGDSTENFYFKIGNPWDCRHFRESDADPNYYRLTIDWKRAFKEGRVSLEQVEEARRKPFFGVLFECRFPPRDTMGEGGWTPLLSREDVDRALVGPTSGFGVNKLGADVAGGGKNYSVCVHRHTNVARIILKNQDPDTMTLAESVIGFRRDRLAGMDGIFVDNVGEGKGATDILLRELRNVFPFNGAEPPAVQAERDMFYNIRAMCYWRAREWILGGGKLEQTDEPLEDTWYQLCEVRYMRSLERMRGKLRIMSKEDMAKLGIPSPDVADALMMTFLTPEEPLPPEALEEERDHGDKLMEKFGLFPKV